MPLFGGRGRGVAGAQQIGTPALNFNPFLSMAALHPGENFQAPNGLTMQALMQAQAGLPGPVGGAAPQQIQGPNIPSNSGAAANAYLGGGSTVAGLTGPSQPNNFENNPSNPYHFLDYDPNAVAPAPMPPRLNPVLGRLGSFIAV